MLKITVIGDRFLSHTIGQIQTMFSSLSLLGAHQTLLQGLRFLQAFMCYDEHTPDSR